MSDLNLLTFGVVVTFIACGGGYVMLRERFVRGVEEPAAAEPATRALPLHVEAGANRRAAG